MKRAVWMSATTMLVVAACTNPDAAPTAPNIGTVVEPSLSVTLPDEGRPGEPEAHLHLIRGLTRAAKASHGRASANMVYHGGPVMHGAAVTPIFWGSSWTNSSFAGDKISGMSLFYAGIGGSKYANTTTEYTDGSGQVTTDISTSTPIIDNSAGPKKAPSTSTVLAKVCSLISSPRADGYYPVYVDLPRGSNGYCAWHSAGTCGGKTVQFAFFFLLDGDPGCDPGASATLNHSQGLSALANVAGHELSEALTDPHLNAWYDRSGAENADKCAWTFGSLSVTFANGSKWKIQGNWSNAAYNSKSGYDHAGCIQEK